MMNTHMQRHRIILQSIAHRAMLERGLLPDFSNEALAELAKLRQFPRSAAIDDNTIRDRRNLIWASFDNDDSLDLDQLIVANVKILGAVAWGLSSTDQTNSILEILINTDMANPVPTKVAFPSYPMRLIALENRLAGIENYHADATWLWIGAWHVIALARAPAWRRSSSVIGRSTKCMHPMGNPSQIFGTNPNLCSHGMRE